MTDPWPCCSRPVGAAPKSRRSSNLRERERERERTASQGNTRVAKRAAKSKLLCAAEKATLFQSPLESISTDAQYVTLPNIFHIQV